MMTSSLYRNTLKAFVCGLSLVVTSQALAGSTVTLGSPSTLKLCGQSTSIPITYSSGSVQKAYLFATQTPPTAICTQNPLARECLLQFRHGELLKPSVLQFNATRNLNNAGNEIYMMVVGVLPGPTLAYSPIQKMTFSNCNANSSMGTNLSSVKEYSSELPFKNLMQSSMEWVTQNYQWMSGATNPWNSNVLSQIPVDADGYPLQLPMKNIPGTETDQIVTTLLANGMDGHYLGGVYDVTYDGQGELEFGFDAKVVSQGTNYYQLMVTPSSNGILLKIKSSTLGNHLHNIQVVPQKNKNMISSFAPEFLDLIDDFKVLRFMDWQETNNSTNKNFSDLVAKTHYTQTGKQGVALDYMIELSNTIHADPWFNMPHMATDDFVRQFATYVRDNLDPKSKIYLEYSNEVWNCAFSQCTYARNQGASLNLSSNPTAQGEYYYSQRAVEIFKIWESVFGGTSRLVRVLGTQSGNIGVSNLVLNWKNAYQEADALAGAPYFCYEFGDPSTANTVATWSKDTLIDKCKTSLTTNTFDQIDENIAMAAAHNLRFITYEGGQHLVGYSGAENNAQLTSLFQEVNRDPRMKTDLYDPYLKYWEQTSGDIFVHFNDAGMYSKWGSWGMLEYRDQDPSASPKYQAVMESMQ